MTIILFVLTSVSAQSQAELDAYFSTSGTSANAREQAVKRLDAAISSVSSRAGSDVKMLRQVFRTLEHSFLKNYKAYSQFDEIFSTGSYDCLTATALFAHALTRLNYSYQIIETNYHIFLLVKTSQGRVLLETTDRFGGFVENERAIESRIASYRGISPGRSRNCYQYSFTIYQPISADNLTGLLLFNQSVAAYNRHAWLESAILLEKANSLHSTERIEELGAVLLQTVLEASLDESIRNECIAHLSGFWVKRSLLFASN